jgi:hypothetical protein
VSVITSLHSPTTIPIHSTIPVPKKRKRGIYEGLEDKCGVFSQRAKRACIIPIYPKSESTNSAQPTHTTRPTKSHARGCPGHNWNCKPTELESRTYWTSFKKFREHYETHLEDHRVEGYRWQCLLCNHDSFGGNGHNLVQHLWEIHLK